MSMAKQLREKLGVDKAPENIDFSIQYTHTDTHMFMMFGRMIDNLSLTVEQIDDVIKVLGELRAAFVKHQESKNVRA